MPFHKKPNLHLPHVDRHRMFQRTQHTAHLIYFAMVFLESHSIYGYSAGFLFISTAIGCLMHEEV